MAGPGGRTIGRAQIRISPNTGKFRAELLKDLKQIEEKMRVNIPTRIDTKRVAKDAARVKADVERQMGDVNVGLKVQRGRAAAAEIDVLARDRRTNIFVDIERSAIASARSAIDGLSSSMDTLGQAGKRAAAVTGLVGGLSALASGATAALLPVAQLGVALAPAVGILAGLPALGAAAGAAVGTLAVAFHGVGEALGAAVSGDVEALEEALKGLAPAAREVVGEVAALSPQLDALKQSVQGAFFAPLVGSVTELGERLLPALSDGMTDTAEALGLATARMAGFLSGAQSVDFINDLFASTSTAITNGSNALPGFTSGLMSLASAGLPFIEQLGAEMSNVAMGFARWAAEATRTGQATQWIAGAIEVFQQLGSVLGNIGSIFYSIGQAAGDGGLLTTLDSLTGSLADFLNTGEGVRALEGLFAGLSDIGSALSPVLEALVSGIGTLSPAVGRIAEAFGPVLTSAINGLTPALAALEPGITAVMEGLGDGIDALVESGALEELGTALSSILTAVSPLLPVLGELAAIMIGAFADALIAIAPSLETLATEFAETLAPLLPQLAESFTELVEALAPLIPPLVEAFLPSLEALAPLIEMIAEVMSVFADVLIDIQPELLALIGFLQQMVEANANVMSALYNGVSAFFTWAGNITQAVRNAVRTVVSWFSNMRENGSAAARGLRDGAINAIRSLRDGAVNLARGVRDRLVSALGNARDRGTSALRGLRDGAVNAVSGLMNSVTRLPGRIMRVFANARRWLKNAGLNVIYGLMDGINNAVGKLYDRMANIADNVRSYWPFSPAKQGPLRSHPMDEAGRNLAEMLADGMRQGTSLVDQAANGLAATASTGVNLGVSSPVDAPKDTRPEEMIARALEALADQDVVVAVDSQEIARATRRGERDLARR